MVELNDGLAQPVKRPPRPIFCRQDAPEVFGISGAVIGFRRKAVSLGVEYVEGNDGFFWTWWNADYELTDARVVIVAGLVQVIVAGYDPHHATAPARTTKRRKSTVIT